MAKRKTRVKTQRITGETLKAAVRDCAQGKKDELTDAHCRGLQLRVRGDVTWTVRARLHGKQRRWILGGPELKPEIARERAAEVRSWCRRGVDPEKLVVQYITGIPVAHQVRVGGEKPLRSWTWIQAVDRFLDHVRGCRAPDTYDDYARVLGGNRRLIPTKRHSRIVELARFDGRAVATIKREEIAECIADVCKRAHRQGEHLRSVLGSMWSFLGDDAQRRETSVQPNLLLRLKAPDRPLPKIVREEVSALQLFENDSEDPRRDVPSPLVMGRAVAIARSGAMGERASLSVLLLAGSLQRRRAVIGSHRCDFKVNAGDRPDATADIIWVIPPFMRKRSNRRRAHMPHKVVLVAPTTQTVLRLDDLAGDRGYYFPVRAAEGKKTKNPYADPSFINHALQFMPGVDMSCHAWRRGFASHGQRELGLSLQEIKLVLDHSEGAPPGDVTAGNYALDPLLQKKKVIMNSWSNWLETQVRAAIDADHTLLDREALSQAIYRARYGEDRWLRRSSLASKLLEAAE